MRSLDYMNRVEAYVNRLNSERRTVLETIQQVRFLDLMADEINCVDMTADCEEDENKKYGVAPNLDAVHTRGYAKRSLVLEDCSSWPVFSCTDTWGGPDYHGIFAFSVTITEEMKGRIIGFSLDTGADDIWNTDNPQIMVYVNGVLTCAMDLNHHEVILSDCAEPGKIYDIRLYAYVNSPGKSNFLYLKVFAKEQEAEALYYDMKLPLEAAKQMRPEEEKRRKLLELLNQAGDLLDLRVKKSDKYRASLIAASEWLKENLYEKEWELDGPTVYALGHTHIDVAWKWPLRQTREKAVRSFSTVLYLMKRYPKYRFFLSQPQLYEYVKEDAPEIFEQVKERVKEGRWEADGAMWLESDSNLTSGESLIRQILYGKKFFNEEFGIKELNDAVLTVYGYGDGGGGPTEGMLEESKRLSYGIPGVPKVKLSGLKEYLQVLDKNLQNKKLNTWYGDLYLEYHRGTFSSIAENKKNNRICEYKNQQAEWLASLLWWMNKKNENANKNAYPKETLDKAWKLLLLNQFHDILPGSAIAEVYEQSDIDYAKIKAMDEEIISEVLKSLSSNKSEQKNGICAWNPLGFAAEQVIELDKKKLHECGIDKGCSLTNVTAAQRFKDGTMLVTASLPAKGSLYMAASAEKESLDKEAKKEHFALRDENTLETPWYIVSWNELGELTSLYDKEAKREVLEAGTVGNEIVVYEDIPKDYDAWNVESYYSRKHWKMSVKKPCMMTEAGEICAVLHTELSYESSVIEQDIAFFAHTRRIDFKTKIDWKEQQQLVKAEFHLDVMTRTAACEIPYGVMERPTHRNTSWQRAQFEMCAHRFVDLSEPGFGVALLNDGRYGHSIEDSFVSLTLLTSGIFPFPDADKGLHELTYALMPHMGDWREANVVHEAGKLNEKPILSVYKPSLLTEEKSSVRYTMCEVSSPNVIVTSVKRAEDESGLIVRMYESSGIRTNVEWNLEGLCPKYIYECDMMEQKEREVVFDGQRAKFEIRPFEIKTFLLV